MTSSASNGLRAVVFDFDGVILESTEVKTDAFVDLYAGHDPVIVEKVRAHHLANLGISRFKKFAWISENLFGRTLSDEESQRLGDRFSELVLRRVLTVPFVRGVEEALAALKSQYLLFVASGTPDGELKHIVEQRGLATAFHEVHGTPREKPTIVRDIIERYELQAASILFIGDGMSDYEAAQQVGTQFLARDTPDLHDRWVQLGVPRTLDLVGFADTVSAW